MQQKETDSCELLPTRPWPDYVPGLVFPLSMPNAARLSSAPKNLGPAEKPDSPVGPERLQTTHRSEITGELHVAY